VNDLAAREAGQLAAQLSRLAGADERHETRARVDPATFAGVLLAGFSDQVARRTSEGSLVCQLTGGRRGRIQKESLIRRHPLVLAAEVREVEGRDVQVILSGLTAIEIDWLEHAFPRDFERRIEVRWDDSQRRVVRSEPVVFRDLVLEERQSGEPDRDQAAAILSERVLSGELRLNGWDDAVEQWISRLNCLAIWMPELDMPALGAAERRFVIEQMCHGAVSYKEIKDRSPWPALRSWLSTQQSAWLDEFAPERWRLPDGRTARIIYAENADPVVSARIQQLYGIDSSPRVAGGRIALVVSILGPNMRPLQITRDLAGFWQNHYPRLKQELQRKYPKHEWR
jgi:ATP-dependent helicase HrpB